MRFIPMFISASFLLSSALARRAHNLHLPQSYDSTKGATTHTANPNSAGAYYFNDGFFDSVSGGFRVPDLSGQWNTAVAIILGIDGATEECYPFFTGVRIDVDSKGQAIYRALYGAQYSIVYLKDLEISPGDTIQAMVSTTSDGLSGSIYITNGKTSSYPRVKFSPPTCGEMAGWFINVGSNTTALSNFGSLTFVGAKVGMKGGMVYGPSYASIFELVSSKNQTLTSTSVNNDSVTISYEFFGI